MSNIYNINIKETMINNIMDYTDNKYKHYIIHFILNDIHKNVLLIDNYGNYYNFSYFIFIKPINLGNRLLTEKKREKELNKYNINRIRELKTFNEFYDNINKILEENDILLSLHDYGKELLSEIEIILDNDTYLPIEELEKIKNMLE